MATAAMQRRVIEEASDRELERDVRDSYANVTSSMEGKSGRSGSLQKILRLILRWDTEPREKTKARKAVKVLVGVPLAGNASFPFEQSLRDAGISLLDEEMEAAISQLNEAASKGEFPKGYLKDKADNDQVRRILRNSLRINADQGDVNRVLAALRKVEKDDAAEAEEVGTEDSK
jgi:hypothetical protein